MHGRVKHFGISEFIEGGKISMPPVVGVQIFSGTTQLELFMEKSWSFISQFCVNPVLL